MEFNPTSNSEKNPLSFLFHDTSDKIFNIQGGGLSALTVDTVDREVHDWRNEISDYPVEGKANISDNIKQTPDRLSFTCFISNTPIEGTIDQVANFTDRFLNGRKRTQDAYNQLLALKKLRIPVTVATRYRVYENVAIESVSIPREPDDGDALIFDITLKEINIVSTAMTKVPDGIGRAGAQAGNSAKTRAGVKTDAGKSTGRTVTNPVDEPKPVQLQRSALQAIFGGGVDTP